jgi:cytochrome P450/pimeloyl-ACP methyl ester carboxylesterase
VRSTISETGAVSPSRLPLPPGPTSWNPLGQLLPLRSDILGFLTRLAEEYGDVSSFRAGTIRAVLLNHPDHLQEVLATNHRNFVKGRPLRLARQLLGEGLLTSEGELHARQSRIVTPALHPQRLPGYGPAVTDCAARLGRGWTAGTQVNILDEMIRLALAIAGKTMFGWNVDSSVAAGIGRALDDAMSLFSRVSLPGAEQLLRLPLPSNRRFFRARAHLDQVIYGLIEERRRRPGEVRDLLSMLLLAQDSEGDRVRMTDRQVRDEALTLFLTAFDTVSLSLTWVWYALARNPEVEARLWEELDRVLGGRTPMVEDLASLPYTRMVLSETLRLYPPVYAIARESVAEFSVGGFTVPAGTLVLMSPYVTQRDRRYYADPERFDPSRWDPATGSRPPRFSYFPFGGGPRGCIGQAYALQEASLIIATLAQRWRLRLAPGYKLVLRPLINLRPRAGIPMIPEARSNGIRMRPHRSDAALPAAVRERYPFAGRYLSLRSGHRLHYLDEGSGPPLLMLHGNPTWSFYYRDLVLGLRDRYRCIVPDHLGAGLSDKPEDWSYGIAAHAANLIELLTALDLHDITLVTHDWGGPIGYLAAIQWPGRVSRLVTFNTAISLGPLPRALTLLRLPLLGPLVIRGLNGMLWAGLMASWLNGRRLTPSVRAGYLAPYDSWANRVGILRFLQAIPLEPDHPNRRLLGELERGLDGLTQLPHLVIWGLKDPVFHRGYLAVWRRRFPGAEVHQLEDAGHWVVEEAGDRILPLVSEFLRRTTGHEWAAGPAAAPGRRA